MESSIDRFLPRADVSESHEILVRAPASEVFEVAEGFDLPSVPLVRAIFWLRGKILRSQAPPPRWPRGLVAETTSLGWGILERRAGQELIAGAVTQPWVADVKFRAIPPEQFRDFHEPDLVKIVWTIETQPVGPERTRLRTQTRAVATDDAAREKFRRYWRKFGLGIVLIRWLVLPAMCREAERRFRTSGRIPS